MTLLTLEALLSVYRDCRSPVFDRWLLVNKDDYACIERETPGFTFGQDVKPSEFVPRGRVYQLAKTDLDGLTALDLSLERPFLLDETRLGDFYARQFFGRGAACASHIAITLCEGAPYQLPLTKAKRRREAKRFIREEVARRRMEGRRR